MKCRPILFPVLFSLLTAALPAQVAEAPGRARLDRAILIEEQEHDLRQAEKLYREVAENESFADPVRSGAWLRLGQLLLRLERPEEARLALQRAAEGMGVSASAAQNLLEEPEQNTQRALQIREQVRNALRLATETDNGTTAYDIPGLRNGGAVQDLVWIGEPAVPEIIRALNDSWNAPELRNQQRRTERSVGLACLLWKIGGDEVERFIDAALEHPHVVFRRIVVAGAPFTSHEGLVRKAAAFLADPDPQGTVPMRALIDRFVDRESPGQTTHQLFQTYETNRIVELVDSEVEAVRIRALDVLSREWAGLRHEEGQAATISLLAPLLERALSETSPSVGQAAEQFLASPGIMSSAEGRSVFLRRLPAMDRAFNNSLGSSAWPSNFGSTTEHLGEVLAAARAMGPAQLSVRGNRYARQESFHRFVSYSLGQWSRETLPGVLELVRMGHDAANKNVIAPGSLSNWLVQRARAEDAEEMASILSVSGNSRTILQWLSRTPLPREVATHLDKYKSELTDDQLKNTIRSLAIAMGRTGHESFGEYLRGLTRANANYYPYTVPGLIWLAEANPSERVLAALRDTLLLGTSRRDDLRARNQLFACLVRLGDTGAIPLLKPAYELGLVERGYPVPNLHSGQAHVGAQWLGGLLENNEIVKWHGYSDADLARCFEQLLTLDDRSVWNAALRSLGYFTSGRHIGAIGLGGRSLSLRGEFQIRQATRSVISVICREWSEQFGSEASIENSDILGIASAFMQSSPDEERFGRQNVDAIRSLQDLCLNHPDPMVRLLSLKVMPSDVCRQRSDEIMALSRDAQLEIAAAAVERFSDAGLSVDESVLARLLEHWDPRFRVQLIGTLGTVLGERAESVVIGLLEDPDSRVRIAACQFLGRSVNPDAVPQLLETMRDPNGDVQEAAKEALDAIRFYHDEKAHWDRVFQGTEIGANSAAEALLQQAAPDQRRDVRLMAIRSLGSLGVPEVLPFLIQYSQEGDEEISEAAKAAVEAINRRTRDG